MGTDNSRPVWLLDVDGVVNAIGDTFPTHVWQGKWRRARVGKFPIMAAQPVLDFIGRMHELGLAEVRWHTTWQEHALELGARLGLPVLPVQDAPEFLRPGAHWWKLPAAQRVVLEEGRPLVWTDDDLSWRTTHVGRALARMREQGPVLTVASDARTGLTPRHLRKIETFLRGYSRDLGHTGELPTPLQRCAGYDNDATGSDRDGRAADSGGATEDHAAPAAGTPGVAALGA